MVGQQEIKDVTQEEILHSNRQVNNRLSFLSGSQDHTCFPFSFHEPIQSPVLFPLGSLIERKRKQCV